MPASITAQAVRATGGRWCRRQRSQVQATAPRTGWKTPPTHTHLARLCAPRALGGPSPSMDVIEEGYEACAREIKEYAKTFDFATRMMDRDSARAVAAVYWWCRRTDQIVDGEGRGSNSSALAELEQWEARLGATWEGRPEAPEDAALLDAITRYEGMDVLPFQDMVRGMKMDLMCPHVRYETFDELYEYCYCVAGTVGLMTLPIVGLAPGRSFSEAKEPGVALGVALQLTNILRDVGQDARELGRIYLPREDMERFGVKEEDILQGRVTEEYKALMAFEIERARSYFEKAWAGVPALAPAARVPVVAAGDIYSRIMDRVEANGYDNLSKRAYVGTFGKLAALPRCWLKVKELEAADAR